MKLGKGIAFFHWEWVRCSVKIKGNDDPARVGQMLLIDSAYHKIIGHELVKEMF